MEYGKLGNTDIEVSKLCVGCMSFGKAGTMHDWTLDEAESENVIDVYKRQTVLCSAAVFLRVLAFGVDNQPDNDRPRNA